MFSVYTAASESFVEGLWVQLGANTPGACSLADLYIQSVPFISLTIFTADRQQPVFVHCLHHHDVCPLHLWTLCSTELIQMYLIQNTVNLVPQWPLSGSDEIRTCSIFHTLHVPCMMQNAMYETNLTYIEVWTQQAHNPLHVSVLLECHRQGIGTSTPSSMRPSHFGGNQEIPEHVGDVFIIKTNRCNNFPNLFWLKNESLHISGSSSAHHQEFIHCTLGTGIFHTGFVDSFRAGPAGRHCSKAVIVTVFILQCIWFDKLNCKSGRQFAPSVPAQSVCEWTTNNVTAVFKARLSCCLLQGILSGMKRPFRRSLKRRL
jgi:hypothetical protein